MGPADALSRKDHIDTTEDNAHTPILPEPMVINALDLALSCHIQNSSTSDLFILKALAALDEGSPSSLMPASQIGYLTMDTFVFTITCMFLPLPALLSSIPSTLSPLRSYGHFLHKVYP